MGFTDHDRDIALGGVSHEAGAAIEASGLGAEAGFGAGAADAAGVLRSTGITEADLTDRATSEADRSLELRTRDRQRKLISKIDAALRRIDDGSYGFCEETGEPISLRRLDARPIATLSIEAQERHERREKVYRDE